MIAAVYGLQALVFVFRRKWDMIGWMIFYILAIPAFSFFLPLYSFWRMDDFSWGATRLVLGESGKKIIVHVSHQDSTIGASEADFCALYRTKVNSTLGPFHSNRGTITKMSCGTRNQITASDLGFLLQNSKAKVILSHTRLQSTVGKHFMNLRGAIHPHQVKLA